MFEGEHCGIRSSKRIWMKDWEMPEAAAPTITCAPSPSSRFTEETATSGSVPESA